MSLSASSRRVPNVLLPQIDDISASVQRRLSKDGNGKEGLEDKESDSHITSSNPVDTFQAAQEGSTSMQEQHGNVSTDVSVNTPTPTPTAVEVSQPSKHRRVLIHSPQGCSLFDFFEFFTITLPLQLFTSWGWDAYFQRWFTAPEVDDDLNRDRHRSTAIPITPSPLSAAATAYSSIWPAATDGFFSYFFSGTRSADNTPAIVHARGVYKYCSDLRSFSYMIGCAFSFFFTSLTTFMMIVSLSGTSATADDAISSERYDSYISTFGYMGLYGYLAIVTER